jgi:hypothetical protein
MRGGGEYIKIRALVNHLFLFNYTLLRIAVFVRYGFASGYSPFLPKPLL